MFSMVLTANHPTPDYSNYGPWAGFARAILNNNLSDAGVNVTPFKAMQLSAVYSCVKIISESLGSLGCYTYRETDNGKELAEDHPCYRLLSEAPNEYMSAMTWVETMTQHLLAYSGNAYNFIERNNDGDIIGLWLWRPDRVTPCIENNEIVYDVQDANGKTTRFKYADVLHIPGMGYDGFMGYNPIQIHRETFGSLIAQQNYGAALYRNGVRPSGIFTHPQKLKPEPFQRLKEQVSQYSGSGNAGKAMILEEGMDFKPLSFSAHDAQYVEQQKFTMTQIAAIYRVPPKMIGDTEAESYGSAEADEAYFVKHTLRPWAVRLEQEFRRKLFSPDERIIVKFDFADLLRGDAKARSEANQILRRNGVINANEWREMEDLNRLDDDIGEKYVIESNMTTMEMVGRPVVSPPPATPSPGEGGPPVDDGENETDEPPADDPSASGETLTAGHRRAFVEILDRMAKIEATSRARAEKAGQGACAKATDDHYKLLVSALGPAADAYATSLALIRRVSLDDAGSVHRATKAAAYIAMNGQPAAEACVDAVMRTIAEAVS